MLNNLFGHKISKELEKTQKLSHLRKNFLSKIKKAEYKGDIQKELMYYSAEIRTLHLSHKIYQEFEAFLHGELQDPKFKTLKFSPDQTEIENKCNLILTKFRDIFTGISKPGGELHQLIQLVDKEVVELEKFQNSPESIQQKIKDMSEISTEEQIEEVLENKIIEKINTFLIEANLTKKEVKKLSDYLIQLKNAPFQAGEKLEENASLFALTVVSLGLISSIGGAFGLPGVAIFGSLFSGVAFGGELLQSLPWLDKKLGPKIQNFLNVHQGIIRKLTKEKDDISKNK
jgi:hypothetical protein